LTKNCPNYFCRQDEKNRSKRVLDISVPNRFSCLKQFSQAPNEILAALNDY
jgi:hypothetical protein